MKMLQKVTVLAFLLGTPALVNAQTTETDTAPMESVTDMENYDDDDGDSGLWGLAGLLGLLGLLGLRRNKEVHHRDHEQVRNTNAR